MRTTEKTIPTTERAVNSFTLRIIFNTSEQYRCKLTRPFNRNHYVVNIRQNSIPGDLGQVLKEISRPNAIHGVYFRDQSLRKPFIDMCKEVFNYSIKIFISNNYCSDINICQDCL